MTTQSSSEGVGTRAPTQMPAVGTWTWEVETGRVELSPDLEQLLGFGKGEFLGTAQALLSCVAPAHRDRVHRAFLGARRQGSLKLEVCMLPRSGGVRWIIGMGEVTSRREGRALRMTGRAFDITGEKTSEERLGSEDRFQAMANAAPVLIWVADPTKACTWFNQEWLDFTGRTMEQELGFGWIDGVHPDDTERCQRAYDDHFDAHEPFDLEYRLRDHEGEYRWIMDRAIPTFLSDGTFTGYVGTCIDITDRKQAAESLQLLSDAGAALSTLDYQEAPGQLAELTVPGFADWCLIVATREDGALHVVGAAHSDPTLLPHVQEIERFVRDAPKEGLVSKVIRTGRAELTRNWDEESLAAAALDEELLELLHHLDPASTVIAPLIARGRTLGSVVCARTSDRAPYDSHDLSIAGELASRAALAMDNARLYANQQRTNEALQLLADAGAELASSLELEETLSNLARLVVPRFADWCSIDILDREGKIRRVVVAHKDPAMVRLADEIRSKFAAEGGMILGPLVERLRRGEPIFLREVSAELLQQATIDPEHRRLLEGLGLKSAMAVPLRAHGRTLGTIAFFLSDSERNYDETDYNVALQIGRRAGLFVDNARLYEESQRMESLLLRANEALRLLAEVGMQLGTSLEYDETVSRLAKLAVPAFADFCFIDVLDGEGRLRRVATETSIPELQDTSERMVQHAFSEDLYPGHVRQALETGEAKLYADVTDELLDEVAISPEHLEALHAFDPGSLVAAPLRARGRVFGVITFGVRKGNRSYSQPDLTLGEEIANRGALFIDNARLYTEAQQREAELRRANETKDEFLSMMSHELRTPLTVINGGARILRARRDQLDEDTHASIIDDIEMESDRLFRMVENLLAMAHMEFMDDVTVEPVLIGRTLERVIEAFKHRRPDREVELTVDEAVSALAAEPTYLEQVARNLLSNADKYSQSGSAVEVRVSREGPREAAIRVLDRGIGIEPDEAERIFERFYRSQRTSKLVGGSGVGLALCKRLVEAMSGRMWARPRTGGGLEVGFTLPLYEETTE